jgi:hypothetical protein
MTNQEAIKLLIEDLSEDTLTDSEIIKALDHAIETLKRFDGAVEVYVRGRDIEITDEGNNMIFTNELYAIPKDE